MKSLVSGRDAGSQIFGIACHDSLDKTSMQGRPFFSSTPPFQVPSALDRSKHPDCGGLLPGRHRLLYCGAANPDQLSQRQRVRRILRSTDQARQLNKAELPESSIYVRS